MNILTFDIEEWYLRQKSYGSDRSNYAALDNLLKQILDLLDRRNIKSTFFCLGGMATDFPDVVKEIDKRGHEVGCHSNHHIWLNKMTTDEVKEDTHASVDSLQQCIGKKIKSYRAPAFSIGEMNKWAFEILAENGIERDASVFPAARDFGGFQNFGHKTPTTIYYKETQIKEFPICTKRILGKEIAYSGGGYFRFFPLWLVKNEIKKTDYAMTYFHLGDLMLEHHGVMTREAYEAYFKDPGTLIARYKRHIKTNVGKKSALEKLNNLLETIDFISLEEADHLVDWTKAPAIVL